MQAATFGQRLKDATWDLHQRAERGALPRDLLRGCLPLDRYIAMLGQLLLVHTALEEQIRRNRPATRTLAALIDDGQFKAELLRQDLRHLGVDPDSVRPAVATRDLLRRIDLLAAERPSDLIGLHYVLEGSTNGNRYLARVARQAYGLDSGAGTRYLDPYGEQQAQRWARFKALLAETEFTAEQEAGIVAAARLMFEGITRVYAELYPGSGAQSDRLAEPVAP